MPAVPERETVAVPAVPERETVAVPPPSTYRLEPWSLTCCDPRPGYLGYPTALLLHPTMR